MYFSYWETHRWICFPHCCLVLQQCGKRFPVIVVTLCHINLDSCIDEIMTKLQSFTKTCMQWKLVLIFKIGSFKFLKEFGCCRLSRTTDLPIMRRRRYLYAILPWLEILLYMDVNISHGVLVQNLPTAETVAPKSVFKKSQQFSMQITQPRFKRKKRFSPRRGGEPSSYRTVS